MLQNGSIQLNIFMQFNMSQSVISRLWNCHQQTGNVTDLPRCGRPRSTTQRPKFVLPLNASLCQAWRVWCRLRQRWTVTQWSSVMFSDGSKFVLDFHDGRHPFRVWRGTGEC